MIIDSLSNSHRYAAVHPLFTSAFSFLGRNDLLSLPDGRIEIHGERLYASVMRKAGIAHEAAVLEAHRNYIDIQCPLLGEETMGWATVSSCLNVREQYDAGKDFMLFSDRPQSWLAVHPGMFAVFFPNDAHAPLVGHGIIQKVVLKVAL